MKEIVMEWLAEWGPLALLLSIGLNIIISISGVIPSVFLTAANISFFGFGQGVLISAAGESLGSIISFYIYRAGLKHMKSFTTKNKLLTKLKDADGMEAFFLIIALRIFPFIPSGLVTLAGSWSKIHILSFALASTIGKIPALLIESYSVMQVLNWNWQGQLMFALISVFILAIMTFRKKSKRHYRGGKNE
ncbi:TVP38/TMEM64 family protein [Peribacillus sp. SCS-155]|uniref:TVP38/TMEM64 family protein n=1 Tax=Peribacillus sedimenti TaxID=3115297 RepID=UPI0039059F28